MFSEGTVHGARAWTSDEQRRIALYRFAPATCCYGRSYYPHWPEPIYDEGYEPLDGDGEMVVKNLHRNNEEGGQTDMSSTHRKIYGLTETQRAVLEPPYALRIDRPYIVDSISGGPINTTGDTNSTDNAVGSTDTTTTISSSITDPNSNSSGHVKIFHRSAAKKQFDKSVFNTEYF